MVDRMLQLTEALTSRFDEARRGRMKPSSKHKRRKGFAGMQRLLFKSMDSRQRAVAERLVSKFTDEDEDAVPPLKLVDAALTAYRLWKGAEEAYENYDGDWAEAEALADAESAAMDAWYEAIHALQDSFPYTTLTRDIDDAIEVEGDKLGPIKPR